MKRAAISVMMLMWGSMAILSAAEPNYAEALQKSLYFYDCQRSGKLPAGFRVPWRGDSCLNDGADLRRDLSGGWYDAGDHVKSTISTGYAMTMLAWGLLENREVYRKTCQEKWLLDSLRHAVDYTLRGFLNDEPGKYELVLQIGRTEGSRHDHSVWVPAEVVDRVTDRPTYRVTVKVPGPDVAGHLTAGWAACSVAFRNAGESELADQLLNQARKLFRSADEFRGQSGKHLLPDGTIGSGVLYRDLVNSADKVAWAACWLHVAEIAAKTPEYSGKFLERAQAIVATEAYQQEYLGKHWAEFSMFRVDKGVSLLLARLTRDRAAAREVSQFLDWWTIGVGDKVKYTPGGLAWRQEWGPLRFAANTSWFAMLWADRIAPVVAPRTERLRAFAKRQVGYVLGDNPPRRSYLLGFGENPWPVAHHRTAHGPWAGWAHFDKNSPVYLPRMRHILYGAMLGMPDDQDRFTPDIQDFKQNEVAIDYQTALPGCLAWLGRNGRGGQPLTDFPPKSEPEPELFTEAALKSAAEGRLEFRARVVNQSGWPARALEPLQFVYRGILPKGRTIDDVRVRASVNSRAMVRPRDNNQFLVTIVIPGRVIYPGGNDPVHPGQPHYLSDEVTVDIQVSGGWQPSQDDSGKWIRGETRYEFRPRPELSVLTE